MPGFDGKDGAAALLHGGKGRKSDRRHVEAGILSGLGSLYDDSAAAGETAATLDAGIRALDGFNRHDRLILHDDRLPQIDRTDCLRRLETKATSAICASVGFFLVKTCGPGMSGFRYFV